MKFRDLVISLVSVFGIFAGLPAHADVKWPADQLMPSFSNPARTQDLISIPPAGTDQPAADQVLFSSLKGIVNRTRPRIWTAEGSGAAKLTWLKDLGLSYSEPSDPWTLFTKYRQEIRGLVVTDDAVPDTVNLATTLAGQMDALVVAPSRVAALTSAPYNFPILFDLRGKFTDKLSVYRYLLDSVWPRSTHRMLVGLNPSSQPGAVREYAVAVNSAVVWLDPRKPDEKTLLDRFLTAMGPGTLFLGWWPEEGSGVGESSAHGVVTVASDWCTNLSTFSGTSRRVAVRPTPTDLPPIENKIYISFIMSDGDNLQFQEHHLRDMWNDPNRGKVPMGWTMSPMMLDAMPGALNYYYKTATPNDCLLSGPSGAGYTYPNDWTDPAALDHYISMSDEYCRRSGLRIITVWNTINGGIKPGVGAAYAENAPSLLGLTGEDAGNGLTIYDNKLPGFSLSATYCGNMEQLTREIRGNSANWDGKSPRFLIIQANPWGGLMPKDFVNLVSGLDSHYEVVRPDTIFEMMRYVHGLPIDPLKPRE